MTTNCSRNSSGKIPKPPRRACAAARQSRLFRRAAERWQRPRRRGNHAGGLHHSGAESEKFFPQDDFVRLAVSNDAADGGEFSAWRDPPAKTRTGGVYAIYFE